jgi:hypothetical protein
VVITTISISVIITAITIRTGIIIIIPIQIVPAEVILIPRLITIITVLPAEAIPLLPATLHLQEAAVVVVAG